MRIKVLLFIDSFRIGGMHKQVLYLAKHLDRNKFDPIICVQSSAGGLLADFENSGSKLVSLNWTKRLEIGVFRRFIQLLHKAQPDIIFITAPQNLFYYRIARFFYRGKTIQVGSFRAMNFWLGHLGSIYEPVDALLSKWMIFTSMHVVVNSMAMAERYTGFLPRMAKRKIHVIYNGSDFNFPVTIPADAMRKQLQILPANIAIVMVARLDPWKDFDTLLDAAEIVVAKHTHVKFLLVGEGKLRSYVEDKIVQMRLQNNVFILGEKKDIYNYINLADISVLSTKGEGFSNSILESMAFAKPVIATDVGGNSELVGRTNETGFLVPPYSPAIFAAIINDLVIDIELRLRVGALAKKKIENLCDLNTFVSSYEELFTESIEASVKI